MRSFEKFWSKISQIINLLCSSHCHLSPGSETPAAWNMPATFTQLFMLSLGAYHYRYIFNPTTSKVVKDKSVELWNPRELKLLSSQIVDYIPQNHNQTSLCSWFQTVLFQLCSLLTIHPFLLLKTLGPEILTLVFITSLRNTKNSSLTLSPKYC